jgi:Zn-dependent M28 family amino/carboxypeptidase
LLGSKYYSLHPTFAPGKIAANINYDGGNFRGRARRPHVHRHGKSSLDAIAKALVRRRAVVVPDQFPDKGYFYRSDQFNFAKIGVPAHVLRRSTDYIGKPSGLGRTPGTRGWNRASLPPSPATETRRTPGCFDGNDRKTPPSVSTRDWLVAQADAAAGMEPGRTSSKAARKRPRRRSNGDIPRSLANGDGPRFAGPADGSERRADSQLRSPACNPSHRSRRAVDY